MKKFILIFTILAILFAGFYGIGNVFAFTNSHWFHVVVTPPNAGVQAAYHIYGGISDYDNIDSLVLYLQWTHHKFSSPPANTVSVNGVQVAAVIMQSVPDRSTSRENLKITLALKKRINKGDTIDIKIDKAAGIVNPYAPRPCYQVSVYLIRNGVEVGYIGSDQYSITQSVVSTPKVSVEPAIKGMNASYKISFITGVNGVLHKGDDIRIKFPQGTVIPQSPFSRYVLVNGKKVMSGVYRDEQDPEELRIYLSDPIDASMPVTIQIEKGLGIINPPKAGKYTVEVSTYMEPEWVKSEPFSIDSPSVQNLSIHLNSDIVTNNASITIHFNTSPVGILAKGKHVYIDFPKGFVLPQSIKSGFVIFNGINTDAQVHGSRIVVTVPVLVPNSSSVDIKISDNAGIKNPSAPGNYVIYVSTESDDVPAKASVTVKPSVISNVKFSPLYTGVGINSGYDISFTTGPAGALKSGADFIKIDFGKTFTIPSEVQANDITINNISVNNVSVDAYSVIATVPLDIAPMSKVEVKITQSFGIKNPTKTGKYYVEVSTSKEKTLVKSNAVDFTVLPVVNFTVLPDKPDGDNGIFRTKPSVTLSTPNGDQVYFKVDDEKFTLYGNSPILIPEGKHKLFAYAVDAKGNKGEIEEKDFVVDSTPPTVTFDQGNGDLYVNTTRPILTGHVSEPCVLQINGVPATVNKDLTFTVQLSVTDNSALAIYARDLAGNAVSIVRTIHVDTTPPVITLISPDKDAFSTTDAQFTIGLKLSENGKVLLNGEEMEFDNGIFSKDVELKEGENDFNIVARDIAGNETTELIKITRVDQIIVKLQIGNKSAYVGEKEVKLDTPPIIVNNITLVPLRFVLETFGAKLDWNGALKVITITTESHSIQLQIGSKIALVDNADVKKLISAPIIKNNRTLVPLRFIAETFGAHVEWDGGTKTITITYTP